MEKVCRRLPGTEETLRLLSPFFGKAHIQKALDDRWRTCYGIFNLFRGIRSGVIRVYGVFEMDDGGVARRFCGFEFGCPDETGEAFEHHACWDRHVDAAECATLCKEAMKAEYAREGKRMKYAVGYIPESNRAARLMALRAGCKDLGIAEDKMFRKDGYWEQCRELRIEL